MGWGGVASSHPTVLSGWIHAVTPVGSGVVLHFLLQGKLKTWPSGEHPSNSTTGGVATQALPILWVHEGQGAPHSPLLGKDR